MDDIKEWWDTRIFTYSLLALFYRGEIKTGLNLLVDIEFLQDLSQYRQQQVMAAGAQQIITEINRQGCSEAYAQQLTFDYQRLFVGPGPVLAPPWESIYRTKEKLLFGEPDDAVRKIYHREGLVVNQAEPADHIALELAFMARLGTRAQENRENAAELLTLQYVFLKEHLLSWVPDWQKDVTNHAQTHFWAGLAMITQGWMLHDLAEFM